MPVEERREKKKTNKLDATLSTLCLANTPSLLAQPPVYLAVLILQLTNRMSGAAGSGVILEYHVR